MKNSVIFVVCLLLWAVLVYDQAEASSGQHVKNFISHGLTALREKMMLLRVPLPLHGLKEKIHHKPVPFIHNFHADTGYKFDHRGALGGKGFGVYRD